jgi:hypothetical protein
MYRLVTTVCLGAAGVLALVAGSPRALAQCTNTKLTANDHEPGDRMGSGVAAGPGQIVVGAALDDNERGFNAGAAYVFLSFNGSWLFNSKIMHTEMADNSRFGSAIAMDGSYMVVGAPGLQNSMGGAFIFERIATQWTQVSRHQGIFASVGHQAGASVDISGDTVMFGAPEAYTHGAGDAGVVYWARRSNAGGWPLVTYRHWPVYGSNAGAKLGSSVTISGNRSAAGAPFASVEGVGTAGKVLTYVFGNDGNPADWGMEIVADDATPGMRFGSALDMDGEWMIVGAEGNYQDLFPSAGAAYVFHLENGAWVQTQRLTGSMSGPGARFGAGVQIDGARAVITARDERATYVFNRQADGSWTLFSRITDPDNPAGGAFAQGAAIAGNTVAVGDMLDDANNTADSGAAFVFNLLQQDGSDACAGATPVEAGEYTGCTTAASPSYITTCGTSSQSPDVWFAWTPRCSGNVIVDTIGSEYDTVLSVHGACPEPGNAHTITCNDDAGGVFDPASIVTFDYTAGQTYYIRVAGYNGAAGGYTLRINDYLGAPANDGCAGATVVTPGVTEFVTCRATSSSPSETNCYAAPQSASINNDVWFRYTAACTGTTTIDLCGSSYDTMVAVYLGLGCPAGPGTAIACNDDVSGGCGNTLASRVSFPTIAGFAYTIRVGGYGTSNSVGDGVMSITCATPCPCDWNHNGTLNSQDFFDFLSGFFGGNADYNQSGQTNSQDFFDFLTCFFTGC